MAMTKADKWLKFKVDILGKYGIPPSKIVIDTLEIKKNIDYRCYTFFDLILFAERVYALPPFADQEEYKNIHTWDLKKYPFIVRKNNYELMDRDRICGAAIDFVEHKSDHGIIPLVEIGELLLAHDLHPFPYRHTPPDKNPFNPLSSVFSNTMEDL